jgi:hypothetical protein
LTPEWASDLPITAKVDVYSFGIVLQEILMGARVSTFKQTTRTHDGEQLELRGKLYRCSGMSQLNETQS